MKTTLTLVIIAFAWCHFVDAEPVSVDSCMRYEDMAHTAATDTFEIIFPDGSCDGRDLLETYLRALSFMPAVPASNYLKNCYERRFRLTMLQLFIASYKPCFTDE